MNIVIIFLILLIIFLAIFGKKLLMKFNKIIWSKEKPDKIMGLKVRLSEFDGLGSNPPKELIGVITGFSDDLYHVEFERPFLLDGTEEKYATVTARHSGYPVSRLSKRRKLAAGGKFESSKGFIALLTIV